MDISTLRRNPEAIKASLKEVGNVLYVTQPTKVYTPVRFSERNLAQVGSEIYIVGIYAIVINDRDWAVSLVDAMIKIEPTSYKIVTIEEDDYFEFYFEPGSVFTPNLELVKTDTLTYRIYDEIISKGKIPWYLSYLELGGIFDSAKYHAGTNIGSDREVTELIVSLIARNKEDRTKYYRQTVQSLNDLETQPPTFIPMRSVIYAATNTLNKIAGSYMETGVVSALVSPSERTERIETLLRR